MGIFAEDLINFGNLMEATIDFNVSKEELKNIVGLDISLESHMMSIVKKDRFLVFNKNKVIKLKETKYIINDRKTQKRAIGFDMLLEKEITELPNTFEILENKPYINLWPYIKASELYAKVPNQFKERIIIKDYEIKKDHIVLKLGVQK